MVSGSLQHSLNFFMSQKKIPVSFQYSACLCHVLIHKRGPSSALGTPWTLVHLHFSVEPAYILTPTYWLWICYLHVDMERILTKKENQTDESRGAHICWNGNIFELWYVRCISHSPRPPRTRKINEVPYILYLVMIIFLSFIGTPSGKGMEGYNEVQSRENWGIMIVK